MPLRRLHHRGLITITWPATHPTPAHGGTVPRAHRRTRPMVLVRTIPTTSPTDETTDQPISLSHHAADIATFSDCRQHGMQALGALSPGEFGAAVLRLGAELLAQHRVRQQSV